MEFIDTHAHIYYDKYNDDLEEVLDRARKNNVKKIICVGVDLESSLKSLELAEKYDMIYATAGYHPHESKDAPKSYLKELEEILSHKKMLALGEIGLDFHYNHSDKKTQIKIFKEQLELSKSLKIPNVVHSRNADYEILSCIKETKSSSGVIHCYASDIIFAKQLFEIGYIISFTGLVTFADNLKEVVKNVPINKFMLETDSPYLTPLPYRGKRNEPSMIKNIAQSISEIRNENIEIIALETTKTARNFFGTI
tara:strand:- start:1277 stop:2035 length:759 start_codon:yes stop_codon:yes gene_type:complete